MRRQQGNKIVTRKSETASVSTFSTLIPDELNRFEKKFETARNRVEQAQEITNWVARPAAWRKEEFQPLAPPRKSSRHRQMCVDDIEAILRPNSGSSTWSAKESEITSRQCRYPAGPPIAKPDKFTAFPILSLDMKNGRFRNRCSTHQRKGSGPIFFGRASQSSRLQQSACRSDRKNC